MSSLLWLLAALAAPPPEGWSFLAYERLPAWKGVAADMDTGRPRIHLFDARQFPGHADFVQTGLGTGLTWRRFRDRVRRADRAWLPFFLYDLSEADVVVDGRRRTWAVRVEDYGYVDGPDSLAEDVLQLLDATSQTLGLPKADGVLVLATSPTVRPNQQMQGHARAAGWATTRLSTLTRHAPRPFEVLHPGTAVGTLRAVDPAHALALGPTDIAVFTDLPDRVPPVAGIVTLVPQTPLSHVNLLARNRGTPNVSLARWSVLGARPGDRVRLEAGEQLVVTPITAEEEQAWWAVHPRPHVRIPTVDPTVGLVHFADGTPTVAQVGAKAANYARLQVLLPDLVRPGHALGFAGYLDHVGPTRPLIAALLADHGQLTPDELEDRLAAIRRSIRDTPVEPERLAALHAFLLTTWPGKRIRLRSSTNNEDLPDFNGAGLYRSKGFDVGEDGPAVLADKLRSVYASLWSTEAFAERAFYGVDHEAVAMAVLIHEAFPGEAANGVALTVPGPSGIEVVVNANPGSASVTNPAPGTLPERIRFLSGTSGQAVVEGRSSIGPVFVDGFAAGLLPVLDDAMGRIHASFAPSGYGVDVELKVVRTSDGPQLFVKQARLLRLSGP